MLHQQWITPGSRVEPVKVLPEGSAPTKMHSLQLPPRQQDQQLAVLQDPHWVRAAREVQEKIMIVILRWMLNMIVHSFLSYIKRS